MRPSVLALACLALLPACLPTLGGGDETGVRRVGDMTIISDSAGGHLIIDGNGCQSVLAEGETVAEPVTDIDGNPVCTGALEE